MCLDIKSVLGIESSRHKSGLGGRQSIRNIKWSNSMTERMNDNVRSMIKSSGIHIFIFSSFVYVKKVHNNSNNNDNDSNNNNNNDNNYNNNNDDDNAVDDDDDDDDNDYY